MSLTKGKILDMPISKEHTKTGNELVINGDFATDTDWVKSIATISAGMAHFPANGINTIYIDDQAISVTNGRKYILQYEIISNSLVGNTLLYLSGLSLIGILTTLESTVGIHTKIFDCVDDTKGLRIVVTSGSTSGTLQLDNVSLREITTTDKTPYENDGTLTDLTFTTDHKGNTDKAGSFNGTTSYIDCGNNSVFDLQTEVTVSVWVKTSVLDKDMIIVDKTSVGSVNRQLQLMINSTGKPEFNIYDGTNYPQATSLETIASDTWTHLVGVRGNGTVKIYINSVEKRSTSDTATSVSDSNDLIIGKRIYTTGTTYFTGSIESPKIYNRALSEDEIKLLYESYNPAIGAGSLQKGLVLHQTLAEDNLQSATTFADKTPYENVGTKVGSVLKFLDTDSNYVTFPTANIIGTAENGFTISAWVNNNGVGAQVFYGQTIQLRTNGCYVQDSGGSWKNFSFSSDLPSNGIWHHLTMIYETGGILRMYVNGIETSNSPLTGISTPIKNQTIFKLAGTGTIEFLTGSIGDTRIYNRTLSDTEILTMYRGGVVSDTNLVAHYKMKNKSGTTLTDETATNNGTLTNFADTTAEYGDTHTSGWTTNDTPNVFALDRKGNVKGIAFDGASDYVDCGNDSSLDITSAITISVWVKTNTVALDYQIIVDKGLMYDLQLYDANIRWYVSDLTPSSAETTSNLLLVDNWYHITMIFNSSNVKLYLNSIEVLSTDVAGTIGINTLDLVIGKNPNGWHFNGSIDDVRIYNRALSQAEISLLYNTYKR